MKTVLQFVWHWKLFSLAFVSLIISLILFFIGFHTASNWILGSVSIIEVLPLLWGMIDDLRNGTYGIDILAATAIVASVLLHQYWAAIVVVIMLTGGESLEDFAEHRALSELSTLISNAPTTAHLLKNKKQEDISVSHIKVGDKFIVKPGELVPTDGVIIEGSSSFDESSLTGESVPVSKVVKDGLLSGSVNQDSPVTVRATAIAKDSQYQQIIRLVESASASKAPFIRLADRYAIPFTLIAFAIAGAVWAISGHAIRFLEVIIVATPCPLLLAAPIALISGMSIASKYGVIVKTGSAMEQLAEAETIAFDKTGTLTSGKLSLDKIFSFNGFSKDDVLSYAASIEQYSNHIIAKAITLKASQSKIKLIKIKGLKEHSGQGILGNFKSKKVIVGKMLLLEDEGVKFPASLDHAKNESTTVYVGIENKLAGYITLKDQLREEAANTLTSLKNGGIENFMLITGDNKAVANSIAELVGIKSVISDALPADKLRAIEKIKERPVVFVGDGVNDAPVLTAADVGIALGARGSTAASESADMVVMNDDIARVATAYTISRKTFGIARQSILVGIALSVVLMLIFATGKFVPIYGAILQEVVDVFVIFNALRVHNIKI